MCRDTEDWWSRHRSLSLFPSRSVFRGMLSCCCCFLASSNAHQPHRLNVCSLCIVHAHFTSVIICKWWIALTSGIYNLVIIILMFYAFLAAAAFAAPEGYIAHRFSFAMFLGDPRANGMLLFQNTHSRNYVRASMVVACTHIVAEVAHRRSTINSTDDSHSTDISIQKWKTKKWNENETNIRPISPVLSLSRSSHLSHHWHRMYYGIWMNHTHSCRRTLTEEKNRRRRYT